MPSTNYSTTDLPPVLRRQLSAIPPAHLDEIISLALEATAHDPSIDFLAAVKALWRCNAHNPRSYGAMSEDPSDSEREPHAKTIVQGEEKVRSDNQHRSQAQDLDEGKSHDQRTRYTYDLDTEMPDAPSPTPSPPASPSQSTPKPQTPSPSLSTSQAKPAAAVSSQPSDDTSTPPSQHIHHHQRQSHNRARILAFLRNRTHPSVNTANMSWQRREQLALAQSYLQAFDLWPHARSSEKRCEGLLTRYGNL
ncbi:hypothetical protein PSPO01_08246 [Paraphaeosphaeria sporulosa]